MLGVAAIVLFTACHNTNAFDFSRLNGVEAEGYWGVPLVNAEYSIGDILNMANDIEYLHVNENGTMEIRYEMDKLNFDWKIDKGEFEFTPGDIEIIVEQKPTVTFKYTGGPIYVPRSADPDYEPVDVKA